MAITSNTSTVPMKPALISLDPRYLSIGLRAPSGRLLDPGEHRRAALQVGDPECDAADVVLDEAAVGAQTRQLAVVTRHALDTGVEAVLAREKQWRQPVQLVDR